MSVPAAANEARSEVIAPNGTQNLTAPRSMRWFFQVGDERGRGAGEEIQQIDASGGKLRHILHERQPEQQQRAAADAAAAQHAGQQTDHERAHSSSTARMPPYRMSRAKARRSHSVRSRPKMRPASTPPAAPPRR